MAITKFYPGYYPGDPMVRPPGGKYVPPPAQEFNFDILMEQIAAMENPLGGVGGIPEWVKERVWADVEYTLKASVYGTRAEPAYVEAFGEEETEDLPGALGIDIDLSPTPWIKDPKKKAEKTLKAMAKSVFFDPDDWTARQRNQMWSAIVYGGKEAAEAAQPSALLQGAATATTKAALSLAGERKTVATPGVLRVMNSGVTDNAGNDLGSAFGKAIINFQGNRQVAFFRGSNYDKVVSAATEAVATPLRQSIQRMSPEMAAAARGFVARVDFTRDVGATDELAADLEKALGKFQVESGVEIQKPWAELRAQLQGPDNIFDRLENLRSSGVLSPAEVAQLNKLIGPYENVLKDLRNAVGTPSTISPAQAKLLANKLHSIRKASFKSGGLTGGDIFRASLERRLLHALEQEIIRDPTGVLATGGDLTQKIKLLLPRLTYDNDSAMYREFISQMEGGRIRMLFIWPLIKDRLHGFTPAYYTGELMRRTHYLGLKIDAEALNATYRNPLAKLFYGTANALIKSNNPISKALFVNRFRIDINGKRILVEGGDHFKAVETLNRWLLEGKLDATQLRDLLAHAKNPGDVKKFLYNLHKFDLTEIKQNAEKIHQFNNWLKDQALLKGVAPETLLKALQKYGADPSTVMRITQRYAGLLEKLTQKLNQIQKVLFQSFIGKAVGKILNIKTVIAEAITDAVIAAGAALTGGTGLAIAAPIKFALQWVITKALDIGSALLKFTVSFDFDALDKALTESVKIVIDILKWFFAILVLIVGGTVFVFAVILGAITPTNPAKGIGGDYQTMSEIVPAGEQPPAVVGGCPINPDDRVRGCASYPVCHGTASYWEGATGVYCSYGIPWIANTTPGCMGCAAAGFNPAACPGAACAPTSPADNICNDYGRSPAQPYYGFAFDVTTTGDTNVYLPSIGNVTEWHRTGGPTAISSGSWGYAVFLRATDPEDGTEYQLALLHLNASLWPATAVGEAIGTLYEEDFARHVHIELMINGTPVRPELYFCL